MSSGATPLNRKRTHSLEHGSERSGPDVNSKKPRTSSGAPPNRKKRGKRRNAPEVEDIGGSNSTGSHSGGTELMSPEVQHRSGHRGKPRRVVESDDEEDVDIVPGPTPHPQVTRKVCHGRALCCFLKLIFDSHKIMPLLLHLLLPSRAKRGRQTPYHSYQCWTPKTSRRRQKN